MTRSKPRSNAVGRPRIALRSLRRMGAKSTLTFFSDRFQSTDALVLDESSVDGTFIAECVRRLIGSVSNPVALPETLSKDEIQAYRERILADLEGELVQVRQHQPDDPFDPRNPFMRKLLGAIDTKLGNRLGTNRMDQIGLAICTNEGSNLGTAFGPGIWVEVVKLGDEFEPTDELLARHHIQISCYSNQTNIDFYPIEPSDSDGLYEAEFVFGTHHLKDQCSDELIGSDRLLWMAEHAAGLLANQLEI